MTKNEWREAVRSLLVERRPDWKGRIRFNSGRRNDSISVRGLGTMYWCEYELPPEEEAKHIQIEFEDLEEREQKSDER